jgi:hypothetical protein
MDVPHHKWTSPITISRKAIEELSAICEVALVKHKRGAKQAEPPIVISKMTDKQHQMFETLQLSRYTEAKV